MNRTDCSDVRRLSRAALVTFTLAIQVPSFCVAESLTVNEIVAKVNGEIITRSELDRDCAAVPPEALRLDQQVASECQKILRERIDRILLSQKALEMGINVDAEVSRRLAQMQVESGIADPDEFRLFVEKQAGLSYEEYRDALRHFLLRERVLLALVAPAIAIPQAEIQAYYNQHRSEFIRTEQIFLAQIFLASAASAGEVEKKARDLSERAKRGELASRDWTVLGGFKRSELDADVLEAIWNRERGFVTAPIRRSNPGGFLILRVIDRHTAGQASLEEVESEIRERLYMARFQTGAQALLTKLWRDAFIEIKPGYTGVEVRTQTAWMNPAPLRPETVTKEEVVTRRVRRRLFRWIPVPGTRADDTLPTGASISK